MSNKWSKLDNAAIIFPSSSRKADNQVFRFSCELKEEIQPDLLQAALDETIRIFDVYRYVLKRGLFWYYLEHSDLQPVVREEYKSPCAKLYDKNKHGLLFEVTYYRKRINLEVYHVLSDGTGAMHFLRTLTAKYLCRQYGIPEPDLGYDASRSQMTDDSFARYYSSRKSKQVKQEKKKPACRLKGLKYTEDRLKIITGHMSVRQVLAVAHQQGVTLTAFLCACLMEAIGKEVPMRAKKKDVVIAVPVNLRKYFPSESARNFFSLVFVRYNFLKNSGEFEEIAEKVTKDLKENLTVEVLTDNLNSYSAVEHNPFAKIAPLVFKDFCLKYAYEVSMFFSTATVSNVGAVSMPKELSRLISSFDVYTGTNKLQICLCSFEDTLSVSFTSPFLSSDIQMHFFRKLTELGIETEIYTNFEEADEE